MEAPHSHIANPTQPTRFAYHGKAKILVLNSVTEYQGFSFAFLVLMNRSTAYPEKISSLNKRKLQHETEINRKVVFCPFIYNV